MFSFFEASFRSVLIQAYAVVLPDPDDHALKGISFWQGS